MNDDVKQVRMYDDGGPAFPVSDEKSVSGIAATQGMTVKSSEVLVGDKHRPPCRAPGSADQSDGESVAGWNNPHKWDIDGERCEVCGDKDWFAGPVCIQTIDLSGLVDHLAREADFDRFRLENNLHQMSESWVKDRWIHVANLERWGKEVSRLTDMLADRMKT